MSFLSKILIFSVIITYAGAEVLTPIKQISSIGNVVALTFDDGVLPEIHKQMLDILKEESIPVTFFIMGNRANHEALIRRTIEDGHEIGNHSMTHAVLPELAVDELYREINDFQVLFETTYDYEPAVFRAPMLKYDNRVMKVLKELDLVPINATFGTKDWSANVSAEDVLQVATQNPQPGSIILMHEVQKTVDVLPQIIAFYKDQGFTFVTVSQLLEYQKRILLEQS